jgi:hypothetical protein
MSEAKEESMPDRHTGRDTPEWPFLALVAAIFALIAARDIFSRLF